MYSQYWQSIKFLFFAREQTDMKSFGEGIWILERPFRLLGAEFGNRMTVIKMSDGELLVHSPISLDDQLKIKIEKLGKVTYIITPNAFHGLFVDDWIKAFPEAHYLTAKIEQGNQSASRALSESNIADLSPVLDVALVHGIPKLNEFAFYHNASRTLVLTDLAFNIGKDGSFWTRIFFSLNDAYGTFGPSRLMRSMIEDRATFKQSLLKILEWDFERIIVSHGDIVAKNGQEVMRSAFAQYLSATPKSGGGILKLPARCG
jgi:hypothetical protein